ncbi:MAG: universal stress protein [Deltaproteobacteria bacterium]|nr:universal stress protein [Deltaproteobacteria bacterium]MCL5277571.1 universal stress protein [Deltaproteobacteria bacterium]
MYKKILVATDGSSYARKAIDAGADIAKRFKSELTLIAVIQHPMNAFGLFGIEELGSEAYSILKKKGDEIIREGKEQLKSYDLSTHYVLEYGNPGDTITHYAKKNGVDLIIVGSHGYGEVMAHMLGSVSDRVNHHAHCSVLIVR